MRMRGTDLIRAQWFNLWVDVAILCGYPRSGLLASYLLFYDFIVGCVSYHIVYFVIFGSSKIVDELTNFLSLGNLVICVKLYANTPWTKIAVTSPSCLNALVIYCIGQWSLVKLRVRMSRLCLTTLDQVVFVCNIPCSMYLFSWDNLKYKYNMLFPH